MNLKLMAIKVFVAALCVLPPVSGWAYMEDAAILDKKDIIKLSDEKLIDTYVDVIVEMEASKTFHATSGFTPKEYTAYKDLLRYRIQLLIEIHKRGLEAPGLDK